MVDWAEATAQPPGSNMQSLPTHLDLLENTQLVRRLPDDELTYLFKHAMTQEAAYGSLLHRRRSALERRVAETYERLYPEHLDEYAALLAQHYAGAGDDAKTLEYATRAGDEAFRLYATAEAVILYSLALESAKRLEVEHTGAPSLRHLYTNRGRALELTGRYGEALANYDEMEAQARARGDRAMELASLVARATVRSTPSPVSDWALGKSLSEQALALAQELGDRQAKATILRNLMLLSNFSGLLREAVQYGEESLALARELGLREQVAFTLNDLFRPYASIGEYERARAAADEAREFWRETGNLPMLADNLSRSARIASALGEFDRVVAFSGEALRISESIGNLWGQSFSRMFVTFVYLERGEMAMAIETMQECIRLADEAGFILAQIATRADLSWVYGTLGAVDLGLELAGAARARAEQRAPTFRSWALACQARLYVMGGQLGEAGTVITEAYAAFAEDFAQHALMELPLADAELALANGEYARAIGVLDGLLARLRPFKIRSFFSDALYLKGRALLGLGRIEDASATWQEALAEAESLGSRRVQWQVLAALSEVEKERGHAAEAEALRARSRDLVTYIADHTPPEFRDKFLQQPEVRALG